MTFTKLQKVAMLHTTAGGGGGVGGVKGGWQEVLGGGRWVAEGAGEGGGAGTP